jgi:hypothetical protein
LRTLLLSNDTRLRVFQSARTFPVVAIAAKRWRTFVLRECCREWAMYDEVIKERTLEYRAGHIINN